MHKYLLPFAQIHFVEQKIFAYKCSCCSPIVMVNISALADPQSRSPPPPPFTSFENVHLFWKCSPILKMLIRPKVFKAHHSWLLYSSFFVILDFLYFMFFTNFHKLKNKVNIPKNVHLNLNQIFFIITWQLNGWPCHSPTQSITDFFDNFFVILCTSTDYNPCTISFLYFITNLACSTFASGALLTPLIPNPINSFDLIFGTGNITHFQKIHPNFKYPQPSFFGRKIYFKYLTNKRFSQRFPSRQK